MKETPTTVTAAPAAATTAAPATAITKATEAAPAKATEAATTTATVSVPAEGTKPAPAKPQQQSMLGTFLPLLLLLGIFYFMMIRPQQRKEKERRKMIDELRAGAKVLFAGGLVGTIVEASEKSFVIETAGSRMEVLRSAVQGVITDDAPATTK